MSTRKPPSLRSRQINRPEMSTEASDALNTPEPPNVIRDNFSMPETDYGLIDQLRQACLQQGVAVNKSELVRAGLIALTELSPAQLRQAVARVEKIKVGRRSRSR